MHLPYHPKHCHIKSIRQESLLAVLKVMSTILIFQHQPGQGLATVPIINEIIVGVMEIK